VTASSPPVLPRRIPAAISLVSGALLMTELALTRIFSVTMYYHFAFLAISIALFGLSASGVYVFVGRQRLLGPHRADRVLAFHALAFAVVTVFSLAWLVRLRVGLNYSPENLRLMVAIYVLAALPFFAGGAVISLAISRYAARVNLIYAADLIGAAAGCLFLIPLLNWVGAPGAVLMAAACGAGGAVLLHPRAGRVRIACVAAIVSGLPLIAHFAQVVPFEVRVTKGHDRDRVLFSRWNSFSRVAVYDRGHGDWSLSDRYKGPRPESRFMDIDSAASTPILRFSGRVDDAAYLAYELTALGYRLTHETRRAGRTELRALVIGPGGGRDLLSALVFGATRIDAVEINPIIADDVMRGTFEQYSGGIYRHPRVHVTVDDGRSFVRRSADRYDVIQASLVDTWAATAAGAYTLSENSLYTVEAFADYLDHLSDDGVLTISRWVFDGLRLVSLAQEACERRGWLARDRLAIVQYGNVATFLLKRQPFAPEDVAALHHMSDQLGFTVLYAPDDQARSPDASVATSPARTWTTQPADYARLILAPDRHAFYDRYVLDVRPTTDDRPFFFHTTRLENQFTVAFGRSMLFGNGLSALLSLMGISIGLVVLFVIGPLAITRRAQLAGGWPRWLGYFSCLGAGFMVVEVALLQRFVLLLGHPVYSLTVTLFSLLLGTGIGSYWSRTLRDDTLRARLLVGLGAIVFVALAGILVLPGLIDAVINAPRWARIALAAIVLIPAGTLMGIPLPAGVRLLAARQPGLIPWAWGMNGALSVVGTTLAVFIAMNWGFSATLSTGALIYLTAALLMVRQ
jgi:hypothetical protein